MIRGIIRRYAAEDDALIQLGCGNSRLAEDMAADGYLSMMNIDCSRVVIEQVGRPLHRPRSQRLPKKGSVTITNQPSRTELSSRLGVGVISFMSSDAKKI